MRLETRNEPAGKARFESSMARIWQRAAPPGFPGSNSRIAERTPSASTTSPNISSARVTGILTQALENWAQKDFGKANAWMDRKISSGAFATNSLVGYAPLRIQFEGVLLRGLLPPDPAAAGRRLADLTEDGAFRVLSRDYAHAVRRDGRRRHGNASCASHGLFHGPECVGTNSSRNESVE